MEQSSLMRLVIQALETIGIPYMITGSQASAYYGEPRFTRDIDIVADIKPDKETRPFLRKILTDAEVRAIAKATRALDERACATYDPARSCA